MNPTTTSSRLPQRIAAGVLTGILTALPASAADVPEPSRTQLAMERQWSYMLGGSGEWRTPNPDFADPETTPKEYAIRFEWGAHRQHVTGKLLGIFATADGEKEALYWHFYSYHNPVTDEVTFLQIGWNGTIGVGPLRVDEGGAEILDQIFYHADGTLKAVRHQTIRTSATEHRSNVYERGDDGQWRLERRWTWRRVD